MRATRPGPDAIAGAEIAPQTETRTVQGCSIAIESAGRGSPILYLHGPQGGGWHPFLGGLAADHLVIAPDHPGFGRSATPDWLDNIHDLAFFYRQLLRELDLGRVHVLGHSLGAWIALELAVKDARNVASLSLVAPEGIHAKGVARPDTFLWSPETTIRHLFHDKALGERCLAEPRTPEDEEAAMKNRFMTARLAWQPRFHDPHLAKWIGTIEVPTQLVWGEADEILPRGCLDAYRHLLPEARCDVVPEAGHLPQVERPDLFARLVGQFIAGVDS